MRRCSGRGSERPGCVGSRLHVNHKRASAGSAPDRDQQFAYIAEQRAKFAGRGLPIVGIAIPYGVYDLCANRGFVVVGTSHDTPDFAADNLLRWWQSEGLERYPDASELLVLADSGGSNAPRVRCFKYALRTRLVDPTRSATRTPQAFPRHGRRAMRLSFRQLGARSESPPPITGGQTVTDIRDNFRWHHLAQLHAARDADFRALRRFILATLLTR